MTQEKLVLLLSSEVFGRSRRSRGQKRRAVGDYDDVSDIFKETEEERRKMVLLLERNRKQEMRRAVILIEHLTDQVFMESLIGMTSAYRRMSGRREIWRISLLKLSVIASLPSTI